MARLSFFWRSLGVALLLSVGISSWAYSSAKETPTAAADASTILVPGQKVYAFVPESWASTSYFMTMKFIMTGAGTISSSKPGRSEGYSTNTDTSVPHYTTSTYGDVYQLAKAAGHTNLFYCLVPSLPADWVNTYYGKAQILLYPSTSVNQNWTDSANWVSATNPLGPTANVLYVTPDAPLNQKPMASSYCSSVAYDENRINTQEWAIAFLKKYSSICATTKSQYGYADQNGAAAFVSQYGWNDTLALNANSLKGKFLALPAPRRLFSRVLLLRALRRFTSNERPLCTITLSRNITRSLTPRPVRAGRP